MRKIAIDRNLLKKMLTAVLAAALLLFAAISLNSGAKAASAESLYIRKVVSVVYDDSGSMNNADSTFKRGEKHAYANYAMQAFCGMLNAEDTLYITYMNASKSNAADADRYGYKADNIELSAGEIQNSIDKIRAHQSNGGTPYGAVESAFNRLKAVETDNANTQYWLVVITDGDFDIDDGIVYNEERLNDKFKEYAETEMPNGTHPQITFLGIGNVVSPDEDEDGGIYTYTAQNATGITDAMNEMADRISGRTRLSSGSIKQINSNNIEVSSSIPLLNIVLFTQGTDATVTAAYHSDGGSLPIVRSASLGYTGYPQLSGGAFLVGDSAQSIEAGSYRITFSDAVDLDELVVLFEPALEVRASISINGREISDPGELDDTAKGDKLSVSFKIYEMGTDTVISSDLLPSGTDYEIAIYEDGSLAERVTGSGMQLSDYELKAVDTEIRASVAIDGFNPIVYSVSFEPSEEPRTVYTLSAEFGGETGVHIDDIGGGKIRINFSVYANGVRVTDPDVVRGLAPVITASPDGNSGTTSVSADGTIVYVPDRASAPDGAGDSFGVEVTCTLSNGASVSETYTIFLAKYEIVAADAAGQVKKTGFYNSDEGVSFYITRDGVKLNRAAIENEISISLNEEHSDLLTDIAISDDGTVTVVPYSEDEHVLSFGSWWGNWLYYFKLSGSDVVVTLNSRYGSADAVIDVVGESAAYQILNVYLPLLVEIAIAAFLIAWIILIIIKPRFKKGAVLYVFDVSYEESDKVPCHKLYSCNPIELDSYNKVWSNGRWKFKSKPDLIKDVPIRAVKGGEIEYDGMGSLYDVMSVIPKEAKLRSADNSSLVAKICDELDNGHPVLIQKLSANTNMLQNDDETEEVRSVETIPSDTFMLVLNNGDIGKVNGVSTIKSGVLYIYLIKETDEKN